MDTRGHSQHIESVCPGRSRVNGHLHQCGALLQHPRWGPRSILTPAGARLPETEPNSVSQRLQPQVLFLLLITKGQMDFENVGDRGRPTPCPPRPPRPERYVPAHSQVSPSWPLSLLKQDIEVTASAPRRLAIGVGGLRPPPNKPGCCRHRVGTGQSLHALVSGSRLSGGR